MKKLTLQDSDLMYCKALNVLLNNGQLKIHDVEKDDLQNLAQTLNWIAQLLPRMVNAPEELTHSEVMASAEKVNTDPLKKSSPKKAGGAK